MANVFLRRICPFVVVFSFGFGSAPEVAADTGNVVIARDGIAVDGLALAKGRPMQVAALVDGRLATETAAWSTVPDGILEVRDLGGGRAEVKALRDLFDSSGKEPRSSIRVCVGQSCTSIGVVCLIDVAGRWRAHVDFAGVPVSKDRDFVLAQDGRRVTYRDAVIKLEGASMRLVSGGESLRRFNGTFTASGHANGTWVSVRGFGGTWSATR